MKSEENDFRLNRQARSFRVSNFTLRDFALLVGTFVFLTLVGMIAGSLPPQILPESLQWLVPAGFLVIAAAVTAFAWFQKRRNQGRHDLSPELRALAQDPANLAAAVQLFQTAHPSVSAALAKQRIEEFSRTGI